MSGKLISPAYRITSGDGAITIIDLRCVSRIAFDGNRTVTIYLASGSHVSTVDQAAARNILNTYTSFVNESRALEQS